MSYILDALRKAERDRGLPTVPTLATIHQPAEISPRRLWPWMAGAVVVANAAVLAWLMTSTRAPEPSMRPGEGLTHSAPAAVPAPAPREQAVRAESDKAAADVRPEGEHRRPGPDGRPDRETRPTAGSVRSEANIRPPTAPVAVAEAPSRPPVVPGARAAPDRAVTVGRQAPGRVSPPGPPALLTEKPAGAPSAAASDIRARMRLQAVVFSENPSERIVFINNQKFIEGQSIDGTITVERIMPEGVVLASQGERIVLRADGAGRP